MTTAQIFGVADACIEAGWIPALVGMRYVLRIEVRNTGRAIIHRADVSFPLWAPCRVWLMCGRTRFLLGDSHAIPADLSAGVRPPWTG